MLAVFLADWLHLGGFRAAAAGAVAMWVVPYAVVRLLEWRAVMSGPIDLRLTSR